MQTVTVVVQPDGTAEDGVEEAGQTVVVYVTTTVVRPVGQTSTYDAWVFQLARDFG